jgi:enamine deaminase RidA (YjgF/YER057c/UK114 family)
MEMLQPRGWKRPKGYANGVKASGQMVFVAGQVGWDANEVMATGGFVAQAEQALKNIVAILAEAGGAPADLVRLTWFVVEKREHLDQRSELGKAYQRVIGNHFPAMSVVEVKGLIEEGAKLEIEATAIVGSHSTPSEVTGILGSQQ